MKPVAGSRDSSSQTRAELVLLLILSGVQFTHLMDFMIIMPLGPQLMRLFGISPKEFGFIVSAYTFAAGVFGFLSAFYIDRFDRKSALLVSYIGFTIGTLACALAPSYLLLLVARSLAGSFGGILSGLVLSIVADAVPPERRGRAMGVVMASFSVSSVFGVPFGLFLADQLSWHAPFYFVGGIAALLSWVIYRRLPHMRRHLDPARPNLTPLQLLNGIRKDPNQVNALTFTFLLMLSQFTLIPFLTPSMVSNVGLSESDLPYIYLFGGAFTIFSSPLVGRLSDRLGKARIFTVAALLLTIPYYLITHMGPSSLVWVLSVTTAFFILGNGRFVPAMALVTSTVRPETRGGFMSLNSSIQSLSAGCASFAAGFIVEKSASGRLLHYDRVGYASIFLTFAAIYIGNKLVSADLQQPKGAHPVLEPSVD